MIATVETIIFWTRHFMRPHIWFDLQNATSEAEYNRLASLAGYQVVKKKKSTPEAARIRKRRGKK